MKNKEGGNTITPSKRARGWCFTLNNYTAIEHDDIMNKVSALKCNYIVGKEVGKENTPHLQGYVYFENAKTFKKIKDILGIRTHIEKAKGSQKDNFNYCSKDGQFKSNMNFPKPVITEPVEDPLEDKVLYPYQKEVLELIKEKPDSRSIHWYYEHKGNAGKSSLVKHLVLKHGAIPICGKADNMYHAIKMIYDTTKNYPKIILIDIPRTALDYVNWNAIENIKNGVFLSGKYEGGIVCMNYPHIICFANAKPNMNAISEDRWVIKKIDLLKC